MLFTIFIFVAVLSLLVFVHELGHFISAKKMGIGVEEFGFGFPPRMFGIKKGETIYSINWLPLGGFVKIKGESGEASKEPDSFASRKAWQRALVLVAGVGMNIALAWVLLSIGYMVGMPQALEGLSEHAMVRDEKVQVVEIVEGAPAYAAGMEIGDAVTIVDGATFGTIAEFREYTNEKEGVPIVLQVDREGEDVELTMMPEYLEVTDRSSIGVALMETGMVSYPVWLAPVQGLYATGMLTAQIAVAFGMLIKDIAVGQGTGAEVSGPVGIAVITAQVAQSGLRRLLQFTAILSINLAILNILPIPALDGGRLAFLTVEKFRGRAVSRRIEIAAHNIGFSLLIFLVVIITYRDVVRYGGTILGSISAFFGG